MYRHFNLFLERRLFTPFHFTFLIMKLRHHILAPLIVFFAANVNGFKFLYGNWSRFKQGTEITGASPKSVFAAMTWLEQNPDKSETYFQIYGGIATGICENIWNRPKDFAGRLNLGNEQDPTSDKPWRWSLGTPDFSSQTNRPRENLAHISSIYWTSKSGRRWLIVLDGDTGCSSTIRKAFGYDLSTFQISVIIL